MESMNGVTEATTTRDGGKEHEMTTTATTKSKQERPGKDPDAQYSTYACALTIAKRTDARTTRS